jgi:hypothetical protein
MDPFGRPREDDLGRAIEYTVHHNRATVRVDAEDGGPTEVTFRRPGGDHTVVVPSGQVAQVAWQELNQRHARGQRIRVNREVLPPVTLDALVKVRRAHLAERHTLLRWSLADTISTSSSIRSARPWLGLMPTCAPVRTARSSACPWRSAGPATWTA